MSLASDAGRGAAGRNRRRILPLGDVPSFLRDKTGFLRACHLRWGDQVRLWLGETTWLINDPGDVAHVLAGNASNYEKTPKLTSERGRKLSGRGLHTATRADHLCKRRIVQPLFARQAVELHADWINRTAERRFSSWPEEQTLDVFAEMMNLAQTIMMRALFGERSARTEESFARAVTDRRAYIEYFFTSNLPFPEYWPLGVVRRYHRARHHLHARIDDEISRRRETGESGADFLSMLLAARSSDGSPLSVERIRDEAITITSTGYETVGAALAWSCHLLAAHPRWQQAAFEEIRALAPDGDIGAEAAGALTLCRRVFDESLRLYPPTWLFVRQATDADTLPSGTSIRAGEKLYLCPWTMHRHPAWYPDPERFDPDRFQDHAIRARPRYTFFPFGGGSRLCIGEPFARLEAMILMAHTVRSFQFHPANTRPARVLPGIVLEPRGGLPLRIRRRIGP